MARVFGMFGVTWDIRGGASVPRVHGLPRVVAKPAGEVIRNSASKTKRNIWGCIGQDEGHSNWCNVTSDANKRGGLCIGAKLG